MPKVAWDEKQALATLRPKVKGEVFGREDAGYGQAKFSWNVTIDHDPAVVVVAANEEDVQEAVRFAGEHELPIAVQCTGHGQPRVCRDGLLIVTSNLKSLVIDPSTRRARIGAGCKWLDVLEPAQQFGLAGLSGSAPHVGVVGYTLGGGINLMLRKYGLAIDWMRSARVVTADGSIKTVSPTENPELFWALRGGGGGFCVLTEIELELVPQPTVFGGAVMYDAARSQEVYSAYAQWADSLPDEVTTSIALMTFPPVPFVPEFLRGRSVVIVTGCVCAERERAEALLEPIRGLGEPVVDTFTTIPYSASGMVHQDPVDPLPAFGHGVYLRDFTPEIAQRMLEAIGPAPQSPNLKIEMRQLGGAMARAPEAETCFRGRDAKYILYFLGVPLGPHTPDAMAEQALRVFDALGDVVMGPGPLNWVGEGNVPSEILEHVYKPEMFARMRQIKSEVDPDNRFRFASIGAVLSS